jgi:2-polyprenyl-3-methyl-5-hydroxy-6-metoxy-1,4-benzoquinol methylase
MESVVQVTDGYFRVRRVPTAEELNEFYSAKYYQEEHGPYRHAYSAEELQYFRNKTLQRLFVVDSLQDQRPSRRMLDVGCGEGWALDVFAEAGWDVLGTDFTDTALLSHNPHLSDRLLTGDLHVVIDQLVAQRREFDVVYLASVLEHVPDPERVLRDCLRVAAPDAVLVVAVPNDFSKFQGQLAEAGIVNRPYWVALPDHINYFNVPALGALAARCDWEMVRTLGDYPVEWHLLHPESNYVSLPDRGPAVHKARVTVENAISEASLGGAVHFYSWLLRAGMGRQITAFLQPATLGYRAFPRLERIDGLLRVRPARRADFVRLAAIVTPRGQLLEQMHRKGGPTAFFEDSVVPQMRSQSPSEITMAVECDSVLEGVAQIAATLTHATAEAILLEPARDAAEVDRVRKLLEDVARRELGVELAHVVVTVAA